MNVGGSQSLVPIESKWLGIESIPFSGDMLRSVWVVIEYIYLYEKKSEGSEHKQNYVFG